MSKAELVATVQKSPGKEASSAQAERTVDAVIEGIKIGVKKTKRVPEKDSKKSCNPPIERVRKETLPLPIVPFETRTKGREGEETLGAGSS
jgi:hypothetical protein